MANMEAPERTAPPSLPPSNQMNDGANVSAAMPIAGKGDAPQDPRAAAGDEDDEAKTEASTDDEAEGEEANEPMSQPEQEPPPVRHGETRSILNAAPDLSDTDEAAKATAAEDDDDDDVIPPAHGEKGVEYTLSELFVNPNLKLKSANVVLKKDPFAIPRATDNVTGYRPRFNPLNILMSEEKLLPRNFKFDFSEGIPGASKAPGPSTNASTKTDATTDSAVSGSSLFVRKVAPIRNPQTFGDKLATMGLLMGSMPRAAQASPLINTPTVHNPFGEPLLELVATNEPAPLQPLRTTAELDLGVDMNGISGLSKLSIVANAAADASMYDAAYARVPPTPPAYDGLATYLSTQFGEKRGPHIGHYDMGGYHNGEAMDSLVDDGYSSVFMARGDQSIDEYEREASATSSPTGSQQSMQPVAKKSRSKNVFRPCSAQGCTKGARGKSGLCQKHGGGKRCATPNCPKGAQGSSKFCLFHGGGYRCTMPGCTTGARGTSGLCAKHGGYKRARGEVDDEDTTRLYGDDGQAAKNPRVEFDGRAIGEEM